MDINLTKAERDLIVQTLSSVKGQLEATINRAPTDGQYARMLDEYAVVHSILTKVGDRA